jgi:hypothetical protein
MLIIPGVESLELFSYVGSPLGLGYRNLLVITPEVGPQRFSQGGPRILYVKNLLQNSAWLYTMTNHSNVFLIQRTTMRVKLLMVSCNHRAGTDLWLL